MVAPTLSDASVTKRTARAVVMPAVRGDYVVTPAILSGERPLEFYGRAPGYEQDKVAAKPDW